MTSPVFFKASAKTNPTFANADLRRAAGGAFSAASYDAIRPGYPAAVARLATPDGTRGTVVDGGAGTGQLSRALAGLGHQVYAFDPSAGMCRFLADNTSLPTWQASAEATGLADHAVDCLSYAQAWHWFDIPAASREADRVVRTGGRLLLVWNTLDVSRPEILRLARIMHSGDIQPAGFFPTVAAPWKLADTLRTTMHQELTVAGVHELMHSRSYWQRANQRIRNRLTGNLDWYLLDFWEKSRDDTITLPYRTDAFVYERDASERD